MAIKNLKIGSLLLDQYNPRIPSTSSQREALQQVLDDQQDKLANLAESIVDEGLSPTDNWLVVRSTPSSDKFIVLEGNRRLAALKILQNPSVLTGLKISNGLQKRFERAAIQFNPNDVEPIRCVEMTRDEANPWIQRRQLAPMRAAALSIGTDRLPRVSAGATRPSRLSISWSNTANCRTIKKRRLKVASSLLYAA